LARRPLFNSAAGDGKNKNIAPTKRGWFFLSLALVALAGCNATELVSERAFEEKIERLRVGQTNRTEFEALFGSAQVVERDRLTHI
jgi:hypothetical protein